MGRQLLFGFFSFISSHLVGKICFFHKLLNIMASLDRSCYLFETIIQFFMEWNLFIILILIFAGFCRCQRENICCYGGGLCFMWCVIQTYITIPMILIFQHYWNQVKEAFGFSHKNSSESTCSSTHHGADATKHGSEASSDGAKHQHPGSSGSSETVFGKFKSSIPSSGISSAFERLKSTKLIDLTKRGYEIVKDELSGKPHKKKHLEYEPSASPKVEKSTRTDVVVLPSKQSRWSKKWEAFREKVNFISCQCLMEYH